MVLFLGAPGSGKGTQSLWLAAATGLPIVSTGELLRTAAKRNGTESVRLRYLLSTGALVDDATVCGLLGDRLRRDVPRRGLILGGFPRTVPQTEFLDTTLAELGLPQPVVVRLDVSTEGLLQRLACRRQCAVCGAVYNLRSKPSLRGSRCQVDGGALVQRDDDSDGVILRRIADYERLIAPIVDHYSPASILSVDGERRIDVVAGEILHRIAPETAYHVTAA